MLLVYEFHITSRSATVMSQIYTKPCCVRPPDTFREGEAVSHKPRTTGSAQGPRVREMQKIKKIEYTYIIPPTKLSQGISIVQKRPAGIMNYDKELWRRHGLISCKVRRYVETVAKARIMTAGKDGRLAKIGYRGPSP